MEEWKNGVLEDWSIGRGRENALHYQYSNTPLLQYSENLFSMTWKILFNLNLF